MIDELLQAHVDRHVPPAIMRLTQHLHNIIYIRYFYESLGTPVPDWIKREQHRADLALQDEIDREHHQGGAFHKGEPRCDKEEQVVPEPEVGKLNRRLRR